MSRENLRLLLFLVLLPLFSAPSQAQFVGCRNILQITTQECEVLEKLFADTNGPFWFKIDGWLRSNQPCGWYGIICADTPWPRAITKIHLISNNVGGSLPSELSLLSQLKELVIENRDAPWRFAKLGSSIPTALGDLSELEVLQLSRNNLRGPIPGGFNKLQKLRVLLLDDNDLIGSIPATLGELSELEELNLADNDLIGAIPTELGRLEKLRHLNLSQNNLAGSIPAELGNLKSLVTMDLHVNNLSGTIPGAFSNIQPHWLSLAENNLEGPLDLTIAASLKEINTCFLSPNAPSLCVPDTPSFRALGVDPICGLPLSETCGSTLVDVLSFDAVIEEETILLRWATNRGAPDIQFEIEQKRNGVFTLIGSMAGSGAPDQAQTFTFRVSDPGPGPYIFRLRQVDVTGNALYGPEITVQSVPNDFVFEPAFPNPFRSMTTLRFAVAAEQEVTVTLFDVRGRRVQTLYEGHAAANVTQELQIDAAELATGGLYFVHLRGSSGFRTTQEILLVK